MDKKIPIVNKIRQKLPIKKCGKVRGYTHFVDNFVNAFYECKNWGIKRRETVNNEGFFDKMKRILEKRAQQKDLLLCSKFKGIT